MTFCAGCGSPNLDTDPTCRVCGRSLAEEPTAQPTNQPASMVAQPSGVATPSGFERASPAPPGPTTRADDAVPSFLRQQVRSVSPPSSNESTALITEHDLPEWIRQIAVEDARKLAAAKQEESAAAAALGSSMPSHFGRRALPGETLTSGPASSSWLNRKDAVAAAAGSAWDVTGAAPASRPARSPGEIAGNASSTAGKEASTADVMVGEVTPAPAKRSRGTRRAAAVATRDEPRTSPLAGLTGGDRKRLYLIAALVVALVLLLAVTVL